MTFLMIYTFHLDKGHWMTDTGRYSTNNGRCWLFILFSPFSDEFSVMFFAFIIGFLHNIIVKL